jgi:Spy/CpxP family protein refolding chaperone
MLKKLSWLIPGTLAIAVAVAPLFPVAAQMPPEPAVFAQKRDKLNLSDAQKQQMQQLRQETRAQIEAVLTPEQKAQLQTLKEQGQNQRQRRRDVLSSLNLTPEQQERIRAIRQEAKQKMDAILTPEQKQQLEQRRQMWQQRRQQMAPEM